MSSKCQLLIFRKLIAGQFLLPSKFTENEIRLEMEKCLFIMSTKEKKFHLSEVNHEELLQILLAFFCRVESMPKGYKYQKDGTDFFLEVQLDTTGKIVKIRPSKAFPG
ncbi:unnamed protein product, partial [marine sediment metagenome]